MKLPHLHLPLSASGLAGMKYLQILLAVVGALLLLTSIWIWNTAHDVEDQIAELGTAIVQAHNAYRKFRHQSETEGFDLSPARLQVLRQEVTFAKQVLQQQRFSWTRLLDDLERTTPDRISIESIVLNKETLALSGAALTLQDLTTFVDRLKNHPAFQHIEISSHTSQQRPGNTITGPANFIAFNLAVSYDPAS